MIVDDEAGALLIAGDTRVEERHYEHGLRAHPVVRPLLIFFLGGAAFPVAVDVLFLLRGGGSSSSAMPGHALLFFMAILNAAIAWRIWTRPTAQWRALEEWRRLVRFELHEHRIRFRTERSSSELEWAALQSFYEVDDVFVIQPRSSFAGGQSIIMPKNAFTAAEVDRVRELLRSRIQPPQRVGGLFIRRTQAKKPFPIVRTVLLWLLLVVAFIVIYQIVAR